MSALDFEEIKRAALSRSVPLVRKWLPGGKFEGAEYVVLNPTRADKTPGSFKINTRTGKWSDFADGKYGANLLDLFAYIRQTDIRVAAQHLADELGLRNNDWTIEKSRFFGGNGNGYDFNKARPRRNSQAEGQQEQNHSEKPGRPFSDWRLVREGYEHVASYDYKRDDELLYQVLRYEHPTEEKDFRARRPDGNGGWLSGAGNGRVLYRGDELQNAVTSTVFVCEGEKDTVA
jgi:hypothetical protein